MKTAKLGEVISTAGRKAGPDVDKPVYSITKHAGFVPSLEYFKKQVFSRELSDYRFVDAGDFAYATIHLDEGSIGVAPEPALISPMYTVFRPDPNRVDSDFLIRYLKSPRAMQYYQQLGKGAVHRRKTISLQALGALLIPLPSLNEQRRIAEILDAADTIRTKRRQVLAHLDTLTQSVFHAMFGSADSQPRMASEVMPHLRNGVSPSSTGKHNATVLTLSAVTRGRFDRTASKPGMFAIRPPDDKRVNQGDFLMCRGNGNRALVGVGTFARQSEHDLVFPDTVIAGRIDTEIINMNYLEYAWALPETRSQIEAVARTTNGTFKINQQTLGQVSIPLPPLALQRAFAAKVEMIDAQRVTVARAFDADNELFASLQSRAFTGEL